MSATETRVPLETAAKIAEDLASLLRPVCERVEIAGSIRRGCPTIGDIEIVVIPEIESGWADLFETIPDRVNYFEQQHIFLTRLPDGEFIALYDLSTRQRELDGDCRVRHDEIAGIGTLAPLAGMTGAFVEECNDVRGVWRLDGTFSFGPANTNLDRFSTRVDAQGDLIIDTDSRDCYRSRQVAGLPPFDSDTCGKPD